MKQLTNLAKATVHPAMERLRRLALLSLALMLCTTMWAQSGINIKGTDYTASIKAWNNIMLGEVETITSGKGESIEYSCGDADEDPETRLNILAALEMAVLMTYEEIPIMDDASASLRGMQIHYYTEDYIFGMGRGGIKYYTYNYTDADWDAYCASQNYNLQYK